MTSAALDDSEREWKDDDVNKSRQAVVLFHFTFHSPGKITCFPNIGDFLRTAGSLKIKSQTFRNSKSCFSVLALSQKRDGDRVTEDDRRRKAFICRESSKNK